MNHAAANSLGLCGWFLALAAVLNIATGTGLAAIGARGLYADLQSIDESLQRDYPNQHQEIAKSGWTLKDWIWNTSTGCLAMGLGGWITGSVALMGLWRRHKGKGNRYLLTGAILMAIPGLSPTVCVAIGPLAGLWVVLNLLDESGVLAQTGA